MLMKLKKVPGVFKKELAETFAEFDVIAEKLLTEKVPRVSSY